VFGYVRKCDMFQRAKPAQETRVGLHTAKPTSEPMDRLFAGFVGPLMGTKRGNIVILVVVDSFSKFVEFHPVRRMTSQTVLSYLERTYFPAFRTPKSNVTTMPGCSMVRLSGICVSDGALDT